jgi:hypothetical protein
MMTSVSLNVGASGAARRTTRLPGIRLAREDHRVPNKAFAFLLFLSSYAPAFVILAVRAYGRSCVMFWAAIGLLALSVVVFAVFIRFTERGPSPFRATIDELEPRNPEMAAYVATYLLPFLTVTGANAQDVIALVLFLFFIGVLWVSSGMLYLNPLLRLVGVHIYVTRVRPNSDALTRADLMPPCFLMSREPELRIGDELSVRTLGKTVLTNLQRKPKRKN